MDEAEWLACADPTPMLQFLQGKVTERKLRLFGAACCRRIWRWMSDERSRLAVDVVEKVADSRADESEFSAARGAARAAVRDADLQAYLAEFDSSIKPGSLGSRVFAAHAAFEAATLAVIPPRERFGVQSTCGWHCAGAVKRAALSAITAGPPYHPPLNWPDLPAVRAAELTELEAQTVLLRCIFGNPFRPAPPLAAAVLAWNGATVPRLARSIYEESRPPDGRLEASRLAILADALLDAGCADDDLPAHLRSREAHVRGCWAVDAILGKS